jgi:hypothetical protein
MTREELDIERAKWYEKLKKEGFKDIETFGGTLKDWQTKRTAPWTKAYIVGRKAQWAYFECAARFLNEFKGWKTATDKRMWKMFSEGKTGRFIAENMGIPSGTIKDRLDKYKKIFHVKIKTDQNWDK